MSIAIFNDQAKNFGYHLVVDFSGVRLFKALVNMVCGQLGCPVLAWLISGADISQKPHRVRKCFFWVLCKL